MSNFCLNGKLRRLVGHIAGSINRIVVYLIDVIRLRFVKELESL